MQTYSAAFKARVVQRLMGPRAVSANKLAETVGVSQETLSRWLRQARSVEGMSSPKKRTPRWTGAEKLRVVLAAEGLEGEALGALLRQEGLHAAQLAAWRAAAEATLSTPPTRRPAGASPEAQRIVELERELRRKEAALAETAALLVLKKSPGDLGGRGRYHGPDARPMIVDLIEEAVKGGARRARACAVVGLSVRTVERWRGPHPQDARQGPRTPPANALSSAERANVLALVNSPAYRDASPHQIVPQLADMGVYVASESTIYRLLREARQLAHRGRTQAPVRREVPAHHATGPQQVWSWDITYLKSPVRGVFWYLYLIMDIWSRRIMGWAVHPTQSDAHAAALFTTVCHEHAVSTTSLVLHADNGGPMKGATMLATLERLGVVPSFSRPRVSDDNPYSEALFRTLQYCPAFPTQPFVDLHAARDWVAAFVTWYNHHHQHRAIQFVTPVDRHTGRDLAILAQRATVYQTARATKPERWRGTTRDRSRPTTVYLNDARSATAELVAG